MSVGGGRSGVVVRNCSKSSCWAVVGSRRSVSSGGVVWVCGVGGVGGHWWCWWWQANKVVRAVG